MNTMTKPHPSIRGMAISLLLLLCACLVWAPSAAAADPTDPASPPPMLRLETRDEQEAAFRKGHELFEEGTRLFASDRKGALALFSNAAATWRAIALSAGIHNARLELNIANASLLAGEPARAIAAFRRAQLLDPSNPQVASGLAAARRTAGTESLAPGALRATQAEPGEGGIAGTMRGIGRFLTYAADRTIRWLPVPLVMGASAACYVLTFALGIAATLRWRGIGVRHVIGSGALCLLIAGPVIAVEASQIGVRDAVVIQDAIIARSGPAEMYDPAFKEPLRPGVECRVIELRSGWVHVMLWDGRRAWIPGAGVEFITH